MKPVEFILQVGRRIRLSMSSPSGPTVIIVILILCLTLIVLKAMPYYFNQ